MKFFDNIIRNYVVKKTDDVVEIKTLVRECPCCGKNALSSVLLESSGTYVLWCTACEIAAVGWEPTEVLRQMRLVKRNARKVKDFEEDRRRVANAEGYEEWSDLMRVYHERTKRVFDLEQEVKELKMKLMMIKRGCPLIVEELKNKV